MIKILLVSSDAERAGQIAACAAASGVTHQLATRTDGLAPLAADPDALQAADLLIYDGGQTGGADLDTLEKLLNRHRDLVCTLVVPAPSPDLLIRAMRAGVRHIAPWPLERDSFGADLQRIAGRRTEGAQRHAQVLAFVSCKGGSGTTFVAANLAYALATLRSRRVLLVDLNPQFGDAAHLVCDKTSPATIADVCAQIDRLDASFLDACLTHVHPGFDVLAGAGDPVKAGDIKVSHLERIFGLVRTEYDVVICDIGHSVNPVSIFALDHSDLIFPVLRSSVPQIRAAQRLLDLFRSLGYPAERQRILVNQYERRSQIGLDKLEAVLGAKVWKVLPQDAGPVLDSVNQGVPVLKLHKGSAIAKSVTGLADSLVPAPPAQGRALLGRLFPARPHVPARAT
jgi:pilus assembly protein CpaE